MNIYIIAGVVMIVPIAVILLLSALYLIREKIAAGEHEWLVLYASLTLATIGALLIILGL